MSTAVRCEAVLVSGEPLRDTVEDAAVPTGVELPEGYCIAGKYTIHGVLGHGGVAVVYDAEHTGLDRPVAIKVLHVDADTPRALYERFRREVRISALVHHPNVLGVYDSGALPDGSPFLVMERLNGEDLASLIARGPLPIALVVEIGCQLLRAVGAVADAGIVHRDIKPANVMLHDPADGPRCVKLVDFGISKRMGVGPEPRLTRHGTLVGTPQYMAPEQVCGDEVDVRTDLYAVGSVLYEALTTRAPHEGSNFSELLVSVLSAPVPPIRTYRPQVPAALERIILKAVSAAPRDRHESADAFLAELEEFAQAASLPRGSEAFRVGARGSTDELAFEARPSLAGVRARRSKRLRPLKVGAVALALGAQAAALQLYGVPWFEPADRALAQRTAGELAARALEPARAIVAAPLAEAPKQLEASALDPMPPAEEFQALPISSVPLSTEAPHRKRARATPRTTDSSPSVAVASADVASLPAVPARAPATDTQGFKQTMDAALAALVRGELAEASAHYAEAVRLGPTEPSALRGLGLVSARLGDATRAREALTRYLELAPDAKDAATIKARIEALSSTPD